MFERLVFPKVNVEVVGVSGGEEGIACLEKLSGVTGRDILQEGLLFFWKVKLSMQLEVNDGRIWFEIKGSRRQRPRKISPTRRRKTRRIDVHDKELNIGKRAVESSCFKGLRRK